MKYLFGLVVTLIGFAATAQELNCTVKINADQVQTSNRRIFESLEQAMSEFMSTRKWTNQNVEPEERINCSILFTINKNGFNNNQNFNGTMQVQSTRPVYNSNYTTNILKWNDKNVSFVYRENAPIQFVPNQFRSDLSSILGFYAYMIIGWDYDSFGLLGGQQALSDAMSAMNVGQNGSAAGWTAFESKTNRYWMITETMEKAYQPFREAMYLYHRKGLDYMYDNQPVGQKNILEALKKIEKVHEAKPFPFINQLFFLSKREELMELFKLGELEDRKEMVRICKLLDPSNTSKYEQILR